MIPHLLIRTYSLIRWKWARTHIERYLYGRGFKLYYVSAAMPKELVVEQLNTMFFQKALLAIAGAIQTEQATPYYGWLESNVHSETELQHTLYAWAVRNDLLDRVST